MEINNYSPICLFTYNRLEETKLTIEALQANFLAKDSDLYIFSDGWKNENARASVLAVREYLKSVKGFKKIDIIESENNKGLARSIIEGVTMVLENYGKVIVMEDDLITSKNFLDFMNQSLDKYVQHKEIFSISGYTLALPSLLNLKEDYYLGVRASSWGWGTWKRSWEDIDWEISDYDVFMKDGALKKAFNKGGSDMVGMLRNQMDGKIDSWAIRWCYNQFKRNQYTVFPVKSKVQSIGFSNQATHTKNGKRFITYLDCSEQRQFSFPEDVKPNIKLINEFKSKFSFISRLRSKFNV